METILKAVADIFSSILNFPFILWLVQHNEMKSKSFPWNILQLCSFFIEVYLLKKAFLWESKMNVKEEERSGMCLACESGT